MATNPRMGRLQAARVDGILPMYMFCGDTNRQFQLLVSTNGSTTDGTQASDTASAFVPAPWIRQHAMYTASSRKQWWRELRRKRLLQ